LRKRPEQVPLRQLGSFDNLAGAEFADPLCRFGDGTKETPADNEDCRQRNKKRLDEDAEEGGSPEPGTLSPDEAYVLKYGQGSHSSAVPIQRHGKNVHGGLAEVEKLAHTAILGDRTINYRGQSIKPIGQLRRHGHRPVLLVVDNDAG
jgi:hypothetical protein